MNFTNTTISIELSGPADVDRHNLARSGHVRLIKGVYARTPDISGLGDRDRRRAEFIWRATAVIATYKDNGAVLHGPSALQVMGVDLPAALEDWNNCHILLPDRGSRPRRRGVIAHHSPRPILVWRTFDGLPVLHPVQNWLHLRGATDDQMVEVGDGFMRRRRPLIAHEDMAAKLAGCDSLIGVKRARKVFPLVRPGTDSLRETTTRLLLIRAGLPEPVIDRVVMCGVGGTFFRLDMAYDKPRIGIEYDGADHADPAQMQKDVLRRRLLNEEGWLLITATAADLRDPRHFLRQVESALVLRGGA